MVIVSLTAPSTMVTGAILVTPVVPKAVVAGWQRSGEPGFGAEAGSGGIAVNIRAKPAICKSRSMPNRCRHLFVHRITCGDAFLCFKSGHNLHNDQSREQSNDHPYHDFHHAETSLIGR
jgi:hypothetical protein